LYFKERLVKNPNRRCLRLCSRAWTSLH